ncbi:heme-binding protein 2-like [Salvia divinorum]|uniref:Heme-binding protein 2-like n=1 Tax=Salvia divinorum TaxID=28513 RepID=A0ABD1HIN5_SALDI
MMSRTVLAICCLAISVLLGCKGEVGYEAPPTCARLECPQYTVVHSQKDFEIRRYKDARWVVGPTIISKSYKEAAGKGFRLLFAYYGGKNSQGLKINMTAPVLVAPCDGGYKVHFYLPKQFQILAPTPLNPDILLANLPGKAHQYAAVRRFDGLITDETIPTNFEPLKKSLQSSREYGRAADGGLTMLAAYNNPRQLTDRVNELFIWFN